jgi:hypothetical protein
VATKGHLTECFITREGASDNYIIDNAYSVTESIEHEYDNLIDQLLGYTDATYYSSDRGLLVEYDYGVSLGD